MIDPGALVAESVANGLPVLYVAMNYRLNSKYLPKMLYLDQPNTWQCLALLSPQQSEMIR